MGTLDIHGQARRLLLTWVFYYDELAPQSVLPDGSGEKSILTTPQELKSALSKVAQSAFLLKLGTQTLPPPTVSQIIVLPDKTCLIVLAYKAPGAGPLEVRAPVLRILPPNYLINVRFMGLDGKMGSTLLDRNSPPLMAAVKGEGIGAPEPPPGSANPFRTAFAAELGAAWVHTDWILLAILLLVANPIRRGAFLLVTVIVLRIILVHLVFAFGLVFPWRIPGSVLCLPIIAIATLVTRPKPMPVLLTAAVIGSGFIYTIYDLQFMPTRERITPPAALIGYQTGFLAGFLLALAIILGIGMELNKSHQFHGKWSRDGICWGAAAISLWTALYSLAAY
jgi:hypothetical protein